MTASGGHYIRILRNIRRFVSSDHVVGEIEKAPGNGKVDPLGGSEIDYEFKFGRCLNRHIGRPFALEDAINVARRATKLVDRIGAIGDQTTVNHEVSAEVDRR